MQFLYGNNTVGKGVLKLGQAIKIISAFSCILYGLCAELFSSIFCNILQFLSVVMMLTRLD